MPPPLSAAPTPRAPGRVPCMPCTHRASAAPQKLVCGAAVPGRRTGGLLRLVSGDRWWLRRGCDGPIGGYAGSVDYWWRELHSRLRLAHFFFFHLLRFDVVFKLCYAYQATGETNTAPYTHYYYRENERDGILIDTPKDFFFFFCGGGI